LFVNVGNEDRRRDDIVQDGNRLVRHIHSLIQGHSQYATFDLFDAVKNNPVFVIEREREIITQL